MKTYDAKASFVDAIVGKRLHVRPAHCGGASVMMQEHVGRHPARTVGLPPLRRIVDTFRNQHGSEVERLECGHEIHVRQDHYGPTNAIRRRCKQCAKEAHHAS